MTYTDEQVAQCFKNNLDAIRGSKLRRAMQVSGVDPAASSTGDRG
jgi:hypothetical protein